MNEITSEYDGVVKQILVKNGEAVDYDQPIMIIE
ncbi:MAG: biotin/lipoyl-containing protein [Oscillospiraceae bacterium]